MDLFTNNDASVDNTGASEKGKVKTGLGDVIANITDSLGIEQCAPCKERQKLLNNVFPFTKKARKPTKEDIAFFNMVIRNKRVTPSQSRDFSYRYKRIVRKPFKPCNCPAKWTNALDEIKTVVEYFKQIENE